MGQILIHSNNQYHLFKGLNQFSVYNYYSFEPLTKCYTKLRSFSSFTHVICMHRGGSYNQVRNIILCFPLTLDIVTYRALILGMRSHRLYKYEICFILLFRPIWCETCYISLISKMIPTIHNIIQYGWMLGLSIMTRSIIWMFRIINISFKSVVDVDMIFSNFKNFFVYHLQLDYNVYIIPF